MGYFNWLKLKNNTTDPELIIPRHVAIIMDGNGRWAQRRGLPRTAGHRAGMERIRDAIDLCLEKGVTYLTLYAFSTENWKRPQEEVSFLMDLFFQALQNEVQIMGKKGVRFRFIGQREGLNPSLVNLMEESERITAHNSSLNLNIAINYGGRAELVTAIKKFVKEVQSKTLQLDQITEAEVNTHLYTFSQPDPDLLIRPGGEYRTSNFLIWQAAYAELYFSNAYWPDFGKKELLEAITFYSNRERRFGGIKGGNSGR